MAVLTALECVDLVVPFTQPTPLELIAALKPDVLVKGGDYTEDEVVGASEVRAAGGNVVLIPLRPGYSTTDVIKRIQNAFGEAERRQ
jgi:D-beta-D-heptose 7-phosphate kinase/D-beta-D-heptose 1-phosphate adenosyltransferase